ncbi:MAG TPA: Sec-independent protein translocase protein TatB [Stellaceae bacterium]|jgi:sec-independent protein translocase protein TatB|nr:Sec-independent protein translocase protein TatB [Stellaceae bacterium]
MFDFSWSEILLIGVVALVVIGPKDLPRVLRTAGQWVGRARAIARDFQFQIDKMVRDSELDDVRKTMNAAASGDIDRTIRNFVDPTGEIEKSVSTPDMLGETPTPSTAAPPPEPLPAPAEPEQLALPTIDAPVPAFLQPVLGTRTLEPALPVAETPAPNDERELIPAEPKSGTHG